MKQSWLLPVVCLFVLPILAQVKPVIDYKGKKWFAGEVVTTQWVYEDPICQKKYGKTYYAKMNPIAGPSGKVINTYSCQQTGYKKITINLDEKRRLMLTPNPNIPPSHQVGKKAAEKRIQNIITRTLADVDQCAEGFHMLGKPVFTRKMEGQPQGNYLKWTCAQPPVRNPRSVCRRGELKLVGNRDRCAYAICPKGMQKHPDDRFICYSCPLGALDLKESRRVKPGSGYACKIGCCDPQTPCVLCKQ